MLEGLMKKSPTVQVQRLYTFSEKKGLDFGTKLRKTWTTLSKGPAVRTHWTPPALHPFTLSLATLVPLVLLITLQLLLNRSQRDNGLIFAADINELPLSRTFLYQYFPTIVAVIFSMFWSWIDLEVKRLEPYYRLSKKEGALGKDSLLLCYPYSFLPFVPIRAFRDRHWAVFWASLALVLVTWGLVPVQAGLFSTHHTSRLYPTRFNVSTSYIPAQEQPSTLSLQFAQSSYGIVALNETLPPFMTRDYTLASFSPSATSTGPEKEETETWLAPTTKYGLDMHCEPGITIDTERLPTYNSSTGCTMSVGLTGNDTRGELKYGGLPLQSFQALGAGAWQTLWSTFYIGCPPERQNTYYAAISRNKERKEDPPHNVTTIFCEPFYYEQQVNATVDGQTKAPIAVVATGPKHRLSTDKFNTTWLEQMMNGGWPQVQVRRDALPDRGVPDWYEQAVDAGLSSPPDASTMTRIAVAVGDRPLEDYLDWKVLADSNEKAWRLVFARAMYDALDVNSAAMEPIDGNRTIYTNAVRLEPVFTYIVEGLLAVVSTVASILLFISCRRKTILWSNPTTIASVMSLVAENEALLTDFADLDCFTREQLQDSIQKKTYKLDSGFEGACIREVGFATPSTRTVRSSSTSGTVKDILKPIRPIEFSTWVCVPFTTLFLALAISLALVFSKSKAIGLPLPSTNKIVENLLENYIPTAIATLIEPVWILFNRLLCLLQPLEELQTCKAKARNSICLNYSSLPPQLVVLKALRARHFVLAAVCSMALLANLLAIAFAGLFYHDSVEFKYPTTFQPPFEMKFVTINGSTGPVGGESVDGSATHSGAYRGGTGQDQFFVAQSNFTRGTPLPAWTDAEFFYIPFAADTKENSDERYEGYTTAIGAELDCNELEYGAGFQADLEKGGVNVTVTDGRVSAECTSPTMILPQPGPQVEGESVCQNGSVALELTLPLDAKKESVSQEEKELCFGTVVLGWIRDAEGSCNTTRQVVLNVNNSFFIQCRPRLLGGRGRVRVDAKGRLLTKVSDLERSPDSDDTQTIVSSIPKGLIGQSNKYLFQSSRPTWHNDSAANDFMNYFASKLTNNSRQLDPNQGLPTLADVQDPLNRTYSYLFAIWLGLNKEHLLVPRPDGSTVGKTGWRVGTEERVFLTVPLFAIAEGILIMYTIVATVVFLRRPGQYLPCLPTSIASVVALFAAGGAVRDMAGTSLFESAERANHLEELDDRYGYGNYVGVDGMIHVGIEKTPFVRLRIARRSGTT